MLKFLGEPEHASLTFSKEHSDLSVVNYHYHSSQHFVVLTLFGTMFWCLHQMPTNERIVCISCLDDYHCFPARMH